MDECKKQLDNAISVIRAYCNGREDCMGCPLSTYICDMDNMPPYNWDDIDWEEENP